MDDLNCSLMVLAFVLGAVLTFALMIRRVNREVPVSAPEVPVSAPVGATESTKSESESQDETPKTPADEEK